MSLMIGIANYWHGNEKYFFYTSCHIWMEFENVWVLFIILIEFDDWKEN